MNKLHIMSIFIGLFCISFVISAFLIWMQSYQNIFINSIGMGAVCSLIWTALIVSTKLKKPENDK